MDSYEIIGGQILAGTIAISGAKNSALPLMTATLLTDKQVILHNTPYLADILTMKKLLEELGKSIVFKDNTMIINSTGTHSVKASYDTVKTMRASITVLGPLLAKYKEAIVSLPGGCSFGSRPVDLHLQAMEDLGAHIELEEGYIVAKVKQDRLLGANIRMISDNGVTVLGTANALMAACLAKGITVIEPAAKEPEITDLVELLIKMGAKIQGKGTSILTIEGVENLDGAEHHIISDRIEAGTFLSMIACTGGKVEMTNVDPTLLEFPIMLAKSMGVGVETTLDKIIVHSQGKLKPSEIVTKPYPDFPTDMQPQFMVMQSVANGNSKLSEEIFDDRFHHIAELVRMGAKIKQQKNTLAIIEGVEHLKGAPVMASNLRAGAALVIAGLAAQGKTIVERIYHIDRGYENFEAKIESLGGQIKRIKA